jgi:hypothetical protein
MSVPPGLLNAGDLDAGEVVAEALTLVVPGLVLELVDDDLGAKQLIENSAWSKGLKHSPDGKLIVETEAKAVGQLNKLLVENNINVTSLRSMNSLEAYFLSLTAGNEV